MSNYQRPRKRSRYSVSDIVKIVAVSVATLTVVILVSLGAIHLFIDVLRAIIHP